MLVDTGMSHNPAQDILPYMASIGFDPADLTYVLISHADIDHLGGSSAIRAAAPHARFLAHERDRMLIESTAALTNLRYRQWYADHGIGPEPETSEDGFPVDIPLDLVLSDTTEIRLSDNWLVRVMPTRGHTLGHVSVYDPRSRTLVAGDAVLWRTIPDESGQPLMPPTYLHLNAYVDNIAWLQSMEIDLYSGSHWPLKRGSEVGQFLRESQQYVEQVENALEKYLAHSQRPQTLSDLIDALAEPLGPFAPERNVMLAYPLYAHLRVLKERGLVEVGRNAQGHMTWQWNE
jgi:glyoxylase-like metal-dependent hydrolase (beta-lactamase superfamily II)